MSCHPGFFSYIPYNPRRNRKNQNFELVGLWQERYLLEVHFRVRIRRGFSPVFLAVFLAVFLEVFLAVFLEVA